MLAGATALDRLDPLLPSYRPSSRTFRRHYIAYIIILGGPICTVGYIHVVVNLEVQIFHSIVLFQAKRPIQTKQTLYKKTENLYKAQKTHKHIYTTRSDFTTALLLALRTVREIPVRCLLILFLGKTKPVCVSIAVLQIDVYAAMFTCHSRLHAIGAYLS